MTERLRQRDLESFLTYLRELYVRRDLAGFKRHLLTTITEMIPSEFTTYNELDLRTSVNAWEWEPAPPDPAELAEIFAAYMEENPCVAFFRRSGDGRATKISDFLTQRELRKLGYYSEYLRRVGMDHRMSVVLPESGSSVVALALGRSGKDFSERDRLVLDLLRPHLTQARDNAALTRAWQQPPEQIRSAAPLLAKEALVRLGLTDREAEIFAGIARGETNKEIAARLYVSPLTVKTHLQHVYRKLAVGGRTEALARALEILDLPD